MDLIGDFIRLERAADMFSFREQGVPVWWFIRQRAYALLLQKLTGINLLRRTADSLKPIHSFSKGLGALAKGFSCPYRPSEILALSTSSARRHLMKDGRAFDVFFDFLSLLPDCDYTVMEFPDRTPHNARPYSPKVIYGDWITARGNIARLLAGRSCRGVEVEIRDRLIEMAQEIGIKLSLQESDRLVSREAAFVRFAMPAARTAIDAVRPRIVLVECGYAPSHMVVQLAAKQKGIPVLELQHGLISEQSIGYRFGIDKDSDLEESPFPDKLLVFGEHFKEILMTNPQVKKGKIILIGYPYLWLMLNNYKPTSELGHKTILITSQPGMGKFWADFAIEIAQKSGRHVTIKPHPAEMDRVDSIFSKALSSSLIKVITDQSTLYDLFPRAEFHLSAWSTSHLEAITFGTNDIVVCTGGMEEQFAFLKELGLPFANNVNEVIQVMHNYPDIERVRKYVREKVFSIHENPLEIMRSLIRQYIQCASH